MRSGSPRKPTAKKGILISKEAMMRWVESWGATTNCRSPSRKSLPADGEEADFRAFPVLRTPFSFVNRVANDRIEIVRVRDGRAGEPPTEPQ